VCSVASAVEVSSSYRCQCSATTVSTPNSHVMMRYDSGTVVCMIVKSV
jgi:hypothetical protein